MGRKLRGMDTRAKIHALVEQYGITGESYIASVVNKHGSIGLERGLTVLPQGTVDAEDFLNEKDKFELQMKNVRRELETVEKSAMELEGYSKNPESIPLYLRNDFHRHVTIQNQLQQMQQHLKRIRQNMASEHGNMYTFVKHASIIDGKSSCRRRWTRPGASSRRATKRSSCRRGWTRPSASSRRAANEGCIKTDHVPKLAVLVKLKLF